MRELTCHVGIGDQENEHCWHLYEDDVLNAKTKNKITRGVSFPVSRDPTLSCTIRTRKKCHSLPISLPHLDRTTISAYELFRRPLGQQEHVVGARNYNCSTKFMARHAAKMFEHTIPSLRQSESPPGTDGGAQSTLIAYDDSSADVSSAHEAVRFFINSLINLGFRVFFVQGGFVAIKELAELAKCGHSRKEWLTSTSVTDTEQALFRRTDAVETPRLDVLLRASNANEQAELCRLSTFYFEKEGTSSPDKIYLDDNKILSASKRRFPNELNMDYLQTEVSRVLPYLYLGNYQDASNLPLLKKLGVTHILNVTQDLPMAFEETHSFQYLRLPALDCPEQNIYPFFEKAINFIDGAREVGGVVLAHCLAGISRSASIVMAYMLYHSPLTVLEAYNLLQSFRPIAEPNFAFLGQLDSFRRLTSPEKSNKLVSKVLMDMWLRVSEEEQKSAQNTALTDVPLKKHFWTRLQVYSPSSTACVLDHSSVLWGTRAETRM
ncbi:Dual specificity protein phosphatase 6 [Sparganum proliferum]